MNQVFKSKICWWLFGPLLSGLGALVVLCLAQGSWLVGLLVLGSIAFLVYLLVSTRYTVAPQELLLVCGPMRVGVPVADIVSIRPSRHLISSPALSLDRLEIRFGKYDSVLISPADKAGFLAALHHLNPALRHD